MKTSDEGTVQRGHGWGSALLAVLGGLAWAWCFGRDSRWLLPWLALTPLMLLLGRPRAFLWGWLHGTVSWLFALPWLIETVHTFGGLPLSLSRGLFVLLALYLGLDHGLFAWLGQRLAQRGGVLALLGLPALWVALEVVRALPFGGFPWNLAAYAWVDQTGALVLSSWVGAFGVSWLLVFANVGLALAVRQRHLLQVPVILLSTYLVLILASRFANPEAIREAHSNPDGFPGEVRVVQPNSSIQAAEDTWDDYQRLIELSTAECQEGPWPGKPPRLLVWPESAAFPLRYPGSPQLVRDIERLTAMGCQVVFNTATWRGERVYNSVLTVTADGVLGSYDKRRLVPYGEYVPLADTFSFIGTLARQAGSFTAGHDVGLMPWGRERLGMAICYEVVFPAAVAEQVQAGATILMTVTNDAWYGDSAAPWQHFRAARFRAAENRRPMLRAALTGVSGIIDSRGQVKSQIGVDQEGVLYAWVDGQTKPSPYTRAPRLIPILAFAVALFAIVFARSTAHRVARRSGPDGDGAPNPSNEPTTTTSTRSTGS